MKKFLACFVILASLTMTCFAGAVIWKAEKASTEQESNPVLQALGHRIR